ncbi:hypothetical protein LMG23992_03463 [Cupriavidus laharis]|uniref:BioF2-like acetyltransferase domain-containing protein n=2 Tax=Cupriavidus laharis TaxID=151654 RepID=A0ABN7YZ18_9BURK|nr:hypothetical protein LMG23992_03463 [Cupriavidus laharis]
MRAAEIGDNGRACAIYATTGSHELLVPFIRRALPSGEWDAVSPYGYGGPLVSELTPAGFQEAAMHAAVEALRDAGCIAWFIRLHPMLNADWRCSVGNIVEHGPIVSIDLTKTEAQHWSETVHGHRSDISKARRAGVEVRIDSDLAALARFVELYWQSMDRLRASDYYYFDKRYFETLRREASGSLRLFIAEERGCMIGGALVSLAKSSGILQGHLCAVDSRHLHYQPLKMLIHAQREWGRAHGYKRLNLGGGRGRGGQSEDSLYKFKRGFSPDTHMFRTQRLIVNPQRYVTLCGGNAGVLLERDGFFPAYRR